MTCATAFGVHMHRRNFAYPNLYLRSRSIEIADPCAVSIRRLDGAPLEVTLANSLGPDSVVYVSTSHGVELETQAGSISADKVHGPVTVSPCLQVVDCHAERSGS